MVKDAIKTFGTVDILVNDAGISHVPKSITDVARAEWDRVIAINLTGVFFCCKAVVPHMKEKRYGKIINISSCDAIAPPFPVIAYSAAKAGVLGLTIDLALELARFNVCVNAVLPGAIPTDMWDLLVPREKRTKEFLSALGKTVSPMERFGTPEEIAGAALFFASNLSAYVTGERITVGGGYPLRLWNREG